jgi:hypothetical protein
MKMVVTLINDNGNEIVLREEAIWAVTAVPAKDAVPESPESPAKPATPAFGEVLLVGGTQTIRTSYREAKEVQDQLIFEETHKDLA